MDLPKTAPCADLPCLSASLPGVGGVIKQYDEDFVVEELPRYEACGEGTHTFFMIEKQGLTTLEAQRLVAQALGRRQQDIGYAGLKDAHGLTRQVMSVEHVEPERVMGLALARLRVLWVKRHTNKLKLGHLAGNRFALKLRRTEPQRRERAEAILTLLSQRGVPNYFGPQRFGARGDNAWIGRAVLRGDYEEALALVLGRPGPVDHGEVHRARTLFDEGRVEEAARTWPGSFRDQIRLCRAYLKTPGNALQAWRAVNHTLRKLYVSALQSALFNQVLAERIDGIDAVQTGDVAWKYRNGACFLVEDATVEQPRCAAGEISPTGPIFGARMKTAGGEPGQREQLVLEQAQVSFEKKRTADGIRVEGTRRPLRVLLQDPALEEGTDERGPFLQVSFALPPGSYATCVTRELCKAPQA